MAQAMMDDDPESERPNPEEVILNRIFEILADFKFENGARLRIEELVRLGLAKVNQELESTRMLEAQDSYQKLAESLKEQNVADHYITVDAIELSLKGLCPIYPIC